MLLNQNDSIWSGLQGKKSPERSSNANLEVRQAAQVKQCGLLYPSAHTARPSYTSSFTLQAPALLAYFTETNVTFQVQQAQTTT